MKTSYRQRLERLTAKNTELEKDLKIRLRETNDAQRSLEGYSRKHRCPICTLTEADKLTECGHLFCKARLAEWEEKWLRERDPNDDMQGILECPICREWIITSAVKSKYYS